ncbi:MAG TPA: hypothetical protein V6D43_26545 [Candidatus Sericytochromatia bacterium]
MEPHLQLQELSWQDLSNNSTSLVAGCCSVGTKAIARSGDVSLPGKRRVWLLGGLEGCLGCPGGRVRILSRCDRVCGQLLVMPIPEMGGATP